jgi:hypothetical protein
MTEWDRRKVYESANFFFANGASSVMKLSPDAAIKVCEEATHHDLLIGKIEGGISHPIYGFEARLDCIWDGTMPPLDSASLQINNQEAADFINLEREQHDAFVITALKNSR